MLAFFLPPSRSPVVEVPGVSVPEVADVAAAAEVVPGVVAAGTLVLGTTVAVASVPSVDGTISGCRTVSTGALRAIDTDAAMASLELANLLRRMDV